MHPLAEARKQHGMTQVGLARRLQIDPSIVRHVEAERMKPYPRFRRICAEVFQMPEEDLFGKQSNREEAKAREKKGWELNRDGYCKQPPFQRGLRGSVGYSGGSHAVTVYLHGDEEWRLFQDLKKRWGMESNSAVLAEALRIVTEESTPPGGDE